MPNTRFSFICALAGMACPFGIWKIENLLIVSTSGKDAQKVLTITRLLVLIRAPVQSSATTHERLLSFGFENANKARIVRPAMFFGQ